LAVAAQQWNEPVLIFRLDSERRELATSDDELQLHWSYFAQADPDAVLQILRGLRLRAMER
jgi:hypothetical protein